MQQQPSAHSEAAAVRRREMAKAFEEGLEARKTAKAFHDNPHKMVAYGDPGHMRPAWFIGYNRGIYIEKGLKIPPEDEAIREARYGNRVHSYKEACALAAKLTEQFDFPFVAEDRGEHTSPQFAVIRGWQLGEPVSYGYNGDSYPCGFITKISGEDGRRIEATDNHNGHVRVFWRRRKTASWKHNQTWSLMHGWHDDRNPEF